MKPEYENNETKLFNSPLETGIRAVVVLNAAYPGMFDMSQMTWFDHLVVHTSDIGGPESLHPDLPQRSGEMLVRRTIIEQSLNLMRRLHLITVIADKNGILYQATDEAFPFTELMRSPYSKKLKACAQWLAENILVKGSSTIKTLVYEKFGRWSVEFNEKVDAPRGPQ